MAVVLILLLFSCDKEPTSVIVDPIDPTENIQYKTKGLFLFSENSQQQTVISFIDSSFMMSAWKIVGGSFFDARIDVSNQLLYFFPKLNGEMKAISIHDKTTIWSISPQNSSSAQWFRGVELFDDELFIGDNNGYINSYNHLNNTMKSFQTIGFNYFASHFLYYDHNIYTFQESPESGKKSKIVVYNFGLQIICNFILDQKLIDWFIKDENQIFVFYNTTSGYEISLFSYFYSGNSTIKTVFGSQISAVARLGEDQFVIATDKGLFLYDHLAQNSVMQINGRDNIIQLDYNKDNHTLACLFDNRVEFYQYSQWNFITSISSSNKANKILWCFEQLKMK
ncbi:MAG: hypothetical protein LBU51_03795 [Bacteroidales bacterium]|nr:hypothetical protein [Bacteroidales bacterium]